MPVILCVWLEHVCSERLGLSGGTTARSWLAFHLNGDVLSPRDCHWIYKRVSWWDGVVTRSGGHWSKKNVSSWSGWMTFCSTLLLKNQWYPDNIGCSTKASNVPPPVPSRYSGRGLWRHISPVLEYATYRHACERGRIALDPMYLFSIAPARSRIIDTSVLFWRLHPKKGTFCRHSFSILFFFFFLEGVFATQIRWWIRILFRFGSIWCPSILHTFG